MERNSNCIAKVVFLLTMRVNDCLSVFQQVLHEFQLISSKYQK